MNAKELLELDRRALARLLREGHAIDPTKLDDTIYRGVSLGLPGVVEAATWKTFEKVFLRDPKTGALRGWNVRIEQTGLEPPFTPKLEGGRPVTFGHYVVRQLEDEVPEDVPRGLMIDYGLGGNRRWDPTARLRDPIVALREGSVELLLGRSYVQVLGRAVATPSFFSLERDGPLRASVDAPRAAC